ncbi:MAG: 50S ribosomal protein L3 [Candidatus Colwellbacteria bacterium]|nr:50S ribosomal protein L3 [Candidatus Colwellbacteria bacterium]
MQNMIIGQKVKMDQIFSESDVTPVTWVSIKEPEVVDLAVGSEVKIVGITKGKGFQGVVKRHGFAGGPRSHGQKNRERAPGSLGPTAPQRVIPGRRMAGRMGGDRQTLKKVKVVEWNAEGRMLALSGSLPGRRGSKVKIFA